MVRDWMIWVGCLLLFCAGAVWEAIQIKVDFFVVANIHDFFEILSSLATVIAVCYGVLAWKHQLSGQSDLELARRVAIASLRMKEAALEGWADAKAAINRVPSGINSLPSDWMKMMSEEIAVRLAKREELKLEYFAVLQEARAIWGKDFTTKYNRLNDLCSACNTCAREFVAWSSGAEHIIYRPQRELNIKGIGIYLEGLDLLNAESRIELEINRMTADADAALEKKMFRAN
ncbi:hypothetical protein PS943_01464 [Pseudomonas fluorescens]|uniref:DUF4760 domain-containing protein n=1 Tax=Pseudomonas fluorescens TaxID=294 RepID=A0A5E7W540_PSEFL|nr:hypothetical protein [Pseudomonas fluorescens]VVQ29735.1 hypothetical protein PS943_01464 [Pseudomonas fluorescens]